MISVHAVAGLLQCEDKYLIAKRPEGKPYSGFWEFPGGKIEENESGEHALIRELHEELGIEVHAAEFLFHHDYSYPDKMVHLQIWRVTQFSGEPHGKESQMLEWVTLADMMNMQLLEGNFIIVDKMLDLNSS
jgi:8-oxo-dGTP diphosphatase